MPVFPSVMKEIRNGSYTLSSCTPFSLFAFMFLLFLFNAPGECQQANVFCFKRMPEHSLIAGLPRACGTEPHTHRIWSTFFSFGCHVSDRAYVRTYAGLSLRAGDFLQLLREWPLATFIGK